MELRIEVTAIQSVRSRRPGWTAILSSGHRLGIRSNKVGDGPDRQIDLSSVSLAGKGTGSEESSRVLIGGVPGVASEGARLARVGSLSSSL